MTESKTIIYTKSAGVAEIRFNRPERLNAVVKQLYDEMLLALADAETDAGVRTVVLTGEGRAFCVGADLKEHGKGERTAFERHEYLSGEQQVCKRIFEYPKPVIAAVNGYALGAGAEMAIAADFLLMADDAQLGLPEISIGTFIGGGVSYLLPRLVGLAKARELIFLGVRVSGREAAAIGLANRAFPTAEFTEKVREFAAQLAEKAPISMRMAKDHLNRAADRGFDATLITELDGMFFCSTTKDWAEGIKAFAEKRKPAFKGE